MEAMSTTLRKTVVLGTGELTIEEVVGVARYGWPVAEVGEHVENAKALAAYRRVERSHRWVKDTVDGSNALAYYGINTGFGSKAGSKPLPKADIPWVSRNLIVSHSVGTGEYLHPEIVRAAMLIRANSLAQGYSGVRPLLINTLVKMLNSGVYPAIPEYGSVGASGDLAPLSHLALVLSKRPNQGDREPTYAGSSYDESGYAFVERHSTEDLSTDLVLGSGDNRVEYCLLPGREAMRIRSIETLELGAKEGLAFNNGASFSAAIAALALYDAEQTVRNVEIAASMVVEALLGFRDAFLRPIQLVRHHKGQCEVAERILQFLTDSTLVDGDMNLDPNVVPPQDAYSLRVTPQVVGAAWDTLRFIRRTIECEINAATDNPLIFDLPEDDPLHLPRHYRSVSGANFHGAPIAYAMDFLAIVMTDVGSLSERRIFRLTDPHLNHGLPAMLLAEMREGLTSGMMIAQYLAAGLISDCKTLAHPDSVDSIPTSANQEDHVSMSMNAARHARTVVGNVATVVGIELLCAAIGLEWRIQDLVAQTANDKFVDRARECHKKNEANRTQSKVLYLKNNGLSIILGHGTQVALDFINKALYTGPAALPELGKRRAEEDRFLQPYILRMKELVQEGLLIQEVYKHCNVENR